MGKSIDDEVDLPAFDHRRYNARSISSHASGNQQMKEVVCERKDCLRFH
jgi:hypothetical protein